MSAELTLADGNLIDTSGLVLAASQPSGPGTRFAANKIPRWSKDLKHTAETRELIEHMCKT